MKSLRGFWFAAALLCAAPALWPTDARAQRAEGWTTSASLYLWFPTLGGKSVYPPESGGSSIGVDVGTLLENLEAVFMGTLEAHNGTWGVYSDLVYMDIGGDKSGTRSITIGGSELPAGASADTRLDLTGGAWTLGGSYRVLAAPGMSVDLVAGVRLLDIETSLRWTLAGNIGSIALPDRAGDRATRLKNWDGIVGAKGRIALGDGPWFSPWYVDIGAGDSELTRQAMAGVGYGFGWGDLVLAWRYVGYRFKPGRAMEELSFNGALLAGVFRW